MRTNEIRNEVYEIKKWEEKIKWKDLKYETRKYIYDFEQYETIRSFGDSIYTRKANIVEAEVDQNNPLKNIVEFTEKSRPRSKEGKDKKRDIYESAYALYEGRELALNKFKSRIFPIKATQDKKTQTLPKAAAQGKAGSTSENLLNEIRQIKYFLYRAK